MRNLVTLFAAILLMLLPTFAAADAISQLSIGSDGTFSGKSITIYQKSGPNLFSRATWGLAFVRITLLTSSSTVVQRAHGGAAAISDISEGDIVDATGTISTGADSLIIHANAIHDDSLGSEGKSVAGIIASLDQNAHTIRLTDKKLGALTVVVSSTTSITKGSRYISFADLHAADMITNASGVFDYASNTLSATEVEIYQDPKVFLPQNFQGTIMSIASSTLSVQIGSSVYTVYLSSSTQILSKSRISTALNRMQPGDVVRFYGSIRSTDLSAIDVLIVRDLNF